MTCAQSGICSPRGTRTIALVAPGEVVNLSGAHALRYNTRPDVAFPPLNEAPRMSWGLVWRTGAETDPVRTLGQTARDVGTRAF